MIVLDASVWISALVPHDHYHDQSERWLYAWQHQGQRITVPVLFLAEVAGAISRRTSDSVFADMTIANLLRDPLIQIAPIDTGLGHRAATLAATSRLRGADAVYVALAEEMRVPLITWNHEQRDRAATAIETRLVSELIAEES